MNGIHTAVEAGGQAHFATCPEGRISAEEMDEKRRQNIAYEYLCHLEEAKVWIEACINERLPECVVLEEGLRNGVYLAKLGHFISSECVPLKKIYDKEQQRYEARGLHFRHTDNINHWLRALAEIKLPKIFYPETTDIYERKNMPRVTYCIHALSLYLFKLGRAPQIQDLYGKIKFTDEQISAMRQELDKYGIQMPAFSKIGGILANEMPVDEAALHAAIIAINEAIDHEMALETFVALEIPAAHLTSLDRTLVQQYQDQLFVAKQDKAEVAHNKSLDPDSSYIPDVYDEILTQAELQGNINCVNTEAAINKLHKVLALSDDNLLMTSLRAPALGLRDLKESNVANYRNRLLEAKNNKLNNNSESNRLTKEEVSSAVAQANLDGDVKHQQILAVERINKCVQENDADQTFAALQNPRARLPPVLAHAAPLYHIEFSTMRVDKQGDLTHDELAGGVQILSAIAKVNQAVSVGNTQMTLKALLEPDANIAAVEEDLAEKYQVALGEAQVKRRNEACPLLTHFDIQDTVDVVNQQVHDENQRIMAVGVINEALEAKDPDRTFSSLQLPAAKLRDVQLPQATHYYQLLSVAREEKAQETEDPGAALWYEEIQSAIGLANDHAHSGLKMSQAVAAINGALHKSDMTSLMTNLTDAHLDLHSVTAECDHGYMERLVRLREAKAKGGDCGSGWVMNRLKDGFKFFYNVRTKQYAFDRPEAIKKDHGILTREEIQSCVSDVTKAHDRKLLFRANEKFVVKVQAQVRGHQVRKRLSDRMDFIKTQLPAVLCIQAWARMIIARGRYVARLEYFRSQGRAIVKIQAFVRMYLARKHYLERLRHFKSNESSVVKIQAFMRSNWARHDYRTLMHSDRPSLQIVRKFVHLLDQSDLDYTEEIEVERMRRQAAQEIRTNGQLEGDLNQMDIKIGLLVKNRITLQDVISQHKTLKKYREDRTASLVGGKGLKALSRESRERLEAYQHLFYLLQTQPSYLAKLVFEIPQSRTTKFMESAILTLYNYASNQREEYLLLKLFQTALQEEITNKVDRMGDIVTGNPMVVKMIVSFNRNNRGHGSLRELLNPLVSAVIGNKELAINTNPIEVYKAWINQMETQSGKTSGLPYDVTSEEAMKHEEVRNRIEFSISQLREATDRFIAAILHSSASIPYGMRYMANVLRRSLHDKFPQAAEKDVLKIVGNLIYYRYINSAIVAPDAFDVIDVSANRGLTNDQRRNLGSIAKILQFAASNKGFGGDSVHLSCLNPYIMDAHNKFKAYFRSICDVEEPEQYFNIDQYTDLTRVTKPVIYISLGEIVDMHKLLLEHSAKIAPDPQDPLHDLLDDLGEQPDVDALLGDCAQDEGAGSSRLQQVGKTEVSLTLSNKYEMPEEEDSDLRSLLIRTKRMVVDLIRCQQRGDDLPAILRTPATEHEEREHEALISRRDRVDNKASKKSKLVRQQSIVGDTRLPLESIKTKVKANLANLENGGVVSSEDHFQAVINSLAQDIRNQRVHRLRRKQEILRLKNTLKGLASKRSFFEEQIDYFNQYVKTCLENLSSRSKKSHHRSRLFGHKDANIKKARGSVKYTGTRLHEKGVVLEIQGLPVNQFKNVLFEIHATDSAGVFEVTAKFMGVSMEKVEVVFQDLLQLQYDGVAVMDMFDRAKVNVNLLIFLLNKKFYGKKL